MSNHIFISHASKASLTFTLSLPLYSGRRIATDINPQRKSMHKNPFHPQKIADHVCDIGDLETFKNFTTLVDDIAKFVDYQVLVNI